MLHIRPGDDILPKLKEAHLPGEFIRWADALCQGPTPSGLSQTKWRNLRARFAAANGSDLADRRGPDRRGNR